MKSCIHCVENHVGKARGLWEEALAGYPGRIGMALGQLGLAEEEARKGFPAVASLLRDLRKGLEVQRLDAEPPFEHLLDIIDQKASSADPAERKMVAADKPHAQPEPTPCEGCGGAQPHRVPPVLHQHVAPEGATAEDGRHLILLTALRDFAPSYSLVSVILDQARAAIMAGLRVTIVGMENMVPVRPRIEGVEYEPLIPDVGWIEDEVDDRKVEQIAGALAGYLRYKKAIVLTHDLVFQSWYLSFAKAIHLMPAGGDLSGIRWFHQLHSSVGPRPAEEVARWRATVPKGHMMVAPNRSDVANLAQYYHSGPHQWAVLPNSRDLRSFGRLGDKAKELMSTHLLHEQDVVQIYPVSTPRMEPKGVFKVVEVFGELKRVGKDVRLVLVNAHANGPDARQVLQRLASTCRAMGLQVGKDVLLTSELWPETASEGLPAEDVADFFRLANIFCFPSSSEACGLVMLEAALAGNLLVLNDSLPVLKDFIEPSEALWVRWGSIREDVIVPDAAKIAAEHIRSWLGGLGGSKRAVMRRLCLEQLAEEMRRIWGL